MLRYDKFFKDVSNYKVSHLINPRVIKGDIFAFPEKSILIWPKVSDVVEYIDSKISYLVTTKKPMVVTADEYGDIHTVGTCRKNNNRLADILSKLKKNEKQYNFLTRENKNLTVGSSTLLVFNYGSLNSMYTYTTNPMNLYYKWQNLMHSAIHRTNDMVNTSPRNVFITIDLPSKIPTRQMLHRYMGETTRIHLETLINYKYFNLIEILRFMHEEYMDKSILKANIEKNNYERVTLLFTYNNNVTAVNLNQIASLLDVNGIKTNLKTYKSDTVFKILVLFFNMVIAKQPATLEEIDKSTIIDTVTLDGIVTAIESDEEDETLVIEDMLSVYDSEVIDEEVDESEETVLETVVPDIVFNTDLTDTDKLSAEVEHLHNNKFISKVQLNSYKEKIEKQKSRKSPFIGDTRSLAELRVYKKEEQDITTEETKLTDNIVVLDKSMNADTTSIVRGKYLKETFNKDIVNVIYAMQNESFIIEEHEIIREESILGGIDTHKISLNNINGSKSTIRIKVPVIDDDGVMAISGNKYIMRYQRGDLPIRKIASTEVALSTYYGKLFVTKAAYKKDDAGFWFQKQLTKLNIEGVVKDLVTVSVDNVGVVLPLDYQMISRYVKTFKFKSYRFYFEYNTRATLMDNINLDSVEEKGTLIGTNGSGYIVITDDNRLIETKDGKSVELPNIYELLGIDRYAAPIEYSNIKIFKEYIPVCLILSYYYGLDKLLNLLNVKYTKIEPNARFENTGRYAIKFKDVKYVIERDYDLGDMIISGFLSIDKELKILPSTSLNSRSMFSAVFTALGLPMLYVNEIKLMENMYVDPLSEQVLITMKEPTVFKSLLVRSSELLLDDNYVHPNDIQGMAIRGYERIAGLIYKEIITAMKLDKNRSHFSKSKLEVNPYAVLSKINEDSTTVLIDDLNPMAALKQTEDTTYLGAQGRSELTMVRTTRGMHSSEIGVISESSKDAGSVGITAHMVANPKIISTRGITGDVDVEKDGWSSLVSTSAMLAPFSITDDVKRLNFTSIMNSHVIPINEMRVPYVRTGYESVLPLRVDKKFVRTAKEDGVVENVQDNSITVKYKSGVKEEIKLVSWTTKEEAGSAYTHTLVANLSKGEKFTKDDTIAYDILFFEPDVFNRKRVVYKMGTYLNVALMEDSQTYEDSGAISEKLSDRLGTVVTKVKSFVLNCDDNLLNLVNVGDEVTYASILFNNIDKINGDMEELDERAREILNTIKSISPKSKVNGTVSKVLIKYNCELEDMSKSVKKLVNMYDKKSVEDTGFTGKVNGSYSIEGKSLLEGKIEVKVYIQTGVGMGIGDKAIFGNQIKFTVGEVYNYDIKTKDNTEVEAVFSQRSLAARIVNSPELIGTTSMCLDKLKDKAIELYFS